MAAHLRAGREAERLAREFLERHGLVTVAHNYRCRGGELDLVMRDAGNLVFVEIRYRQRERPATAMETIDRRKRRRIATAARHFLQRHRGCGDNPVRFDVVGMSGPLRHPRIQWLRNAFSTDDL